MDRIEFLDEFEFFIGVFERIDNTISLHHLCGLLVN